LSSSAADVQANSPPRPNTQGKFRNPRAALVQTFAEIGDTTGTLYSLKRLFAHAKAAHAVYVDLREEAGQ
jgi:hypothetical protein